MNTSIIPRLRLALCAGLLTLPAAAQTVIGTFAGTVRAVTDTTDETPLAGSGIVGNVSTFTGTISYEPDATKTQDGGNLIAAYRPASISVTIDGTHTFSSIDTTVVMRNDSSSFDDRIDFDFTSGVSSPFAVSGDQLFRVTLEDSSRQVFSGTGLPTALNFGNFTDGELFFRTDFDRDNNKLWIISGDVTSFSATLSAVPEPSTYATVFGFAVLAVAVWRRRAVSRAPQGASM